MRARKPDGRTATLPATRVTPEERQRIERDAAERGIKTSAWIREAIQSYLDPGLPDPAETRARNAKRAAVGPTGPPFEVDGERPEPAPKLSPPKGWNPIPIPE